MKVIAPSYYLKFHCTASACTHSCCEGWEIDIDEESLKRYRALEGPFGDELRSVICEVPESECTEENAAHFVLRDDGRCPFLNDDGLCRMIIELGEGSLCNICTDHPRFRNFWTDRVEMGLGLACQEAARLILGSDEPMALTVLEDDGKDEELPEDEEYLMDVRKQLFDAVKDREYDFPAQQRLAEYLVWRHIADALYDDRLEERVEFVNDCYSHLCGKWRETDGSLSELVRCAVEFSDEYEYKV